MSGLTKVLAKTKQGVAGEPFLICSKSILDPKSLNSDPLHRSPNLLPFSPLTLVKAGSPRNTGLLRKL